MAPAEVRLASRRITEELRRKAFTSRGLLRLILAHYLKDDPARIDIAATEHGKPYLTAYPGGIQFNVSHSQDCVVYAVTAKDEVGIDVERIRESLAYERIARRYFSSREVAALLAEPPEERVACFFRGWTRKEAFLKVKGVGLSLPLNRFDVSLSRHTPPAVLATRPDPAEASRWRLSDVEVPAGYVGALAVAMQDPELSYRHIEELGHP